MNTNDRDTNTYWYMDFIHLSKYIDLDRLANVIRPITRADFVVETDTSMNIAISRWDQHEVIIAHPLDNHHQDLDQDIKLTEYNSPTCITLALKGKHEPSSEALAYHTDMAEAIGKILAKSLRSEVLHSKRWDINEAVGTLLYRRYGCDGARVESDAPVTYSTGWKRNALVTSIDSLRPKYDGILDFLFIVHPRTAAEKRRPFPLMRGVSADCIGSLIPPCTILSPIEIIFEKKNLYGELVSIPYAPEEMFEQLHDARDTVVKILDYASHRGTKMVGLGALIPSITRQGKFLRQMRPDVAFTTGHGFTALTIARMVEDIEDQIGADGVVAVIGAAGSTGRAALRCMFKRRPTRKILAVDVALNLEKITQIPGWNSKIHRHTANKGAIKTAAIVVCVTNAVSSILSADDFGPNAVVLDDAQPENVDQSVLAKRPDIRVIKCLARIPGLKCPFEMGLFESNNRDDEVSFTCLAETILLAAEQHSGTYIIGDPTDEQFNNLEQLATKYNVNAANFFSFPSIGRVSLTK